jgi:hypothetical protein
LILDQFNEWNFGCLFNIAHSVKVGHLSGLIDGGGAGEDTALVTGGFSFDDVQAHRFDELGH